MEEKRSYIAIDLKSFYASVECMAAQTQPPYNKSCGCG